MILLRHGQSTFNAHFNATRTDPGFVDPELIDLGRSQAVAVAERLVATPDGRGPRRVISSPYRRALATADIIAAALGTSVTVNAMVGERAAFSYDIGSPRSRLAASWPHIVFLAYR